MSVLLSVENLERSCSFRSLLLSPRQCHLFADDQKFLREQAGLLAGALPPQVKEVTKIDSSKTIAVQRKRGHALTQPLTLIW